MSGAQLVQCGTHGETPPAYVCQHIKTSLEDGQPRGLFWSRDDDGHFNGYCDECDSFRESHGGEWNDQTEAFAGMLLICEGCFQRVAEMNGIGELH